MSDNIKAVVIGVCFCAFIVFASICCYVELTEKTKVEAEKTKQLKEQTRQIELQQKKE